MTDTLDDDGGELLPIGVFAREVRLAVSAVRFYDDCGLLPPAFVDPSSGYRYYTADQVRRGRIIRDLRAAEMSIAQIRAVLHAPAPEVSTLLADHGTSLERRFAEATQRLASVAAAINETEIPMSTTCVLPADDFSAAVRQVVPAAARAGTAPDQKLRVIEGVLLTVDDGALRLVATDRYRLAIRELIPTTLDGGDARAVVEVDDLERAATAATGEVTITFGEHAVSIACSGLEVDARTIATAPFPPYERLLPDPSALVHRALVPVAAARERLEAVADLGLAALHLNGGVAIVRLGASADPIAGSEVSGPPVTIGINPKFLLEAAQLAVGPELLIEASSASTPLVVRSATDGSYTCLIMPVRVEFPTSPRNLDFTVVDGGRPAGWSVYPLVGVGSDGPASVTVQGAELVLTVTTLRDPFAVGQIIDTEMIRGHSATFTASVTSALQDGSSAYLSLQPIEGDNPGTLSTEGRVLSDRVERATDGRVVNATINVPEQSRWLRLALHVHGEGTARFRDVAFVVR